MIKKITIGTLSVLGAFYLVSLLFISFTDCHQLIVSEINSPDTKYEVSYYQETCDTSPQKVTVWLGERNSNTKLLIFSAIATTTEKLELSWVNNYELLVTYPGALQPTTIDVTHDNISIKYKRASPSA